MNYLYGAAVMTLLAAGSVFAADNGAATPLRQMSVTGEAMEKFAPDQAVLPITVQTEDKDLKIAKTKNDEKIRAVLAIAKKYNIAATDMQTSYTSVQPQYNYLPNTNKPQLRGYQASASLQFKLSPLDKVAGFMDEVVKAGVDRVDGIQYTLKDDQKNREDVMLKALVNAASKATKMAATLHVTLGAPLQVSESGGVNYPQPVPYMARGVMAMAAAPEMKSAPDLPSGEIEIRQTVNVTYELK